MKPAHLILLLSMNFCWAAVYSSYKVIALPTGGIVTLRFGIAAVTLLLFWPLLPGKAPRGWDLILTCVMGLILYVLGQRLQVYGNQAGTAGNSAVLMSLEPLLVSTAAALFLKEHIGLHRLAGFALGLFGVALLNGVWRQDFSLMNLGVSLIFISSFVCEAAYSVMGKPIILRSSVMKMLAISLTAGTVANLIIDGSETLRAAKTLSGSAWWLLAALGIICTAIGYTVWFMVIRECPINVAALTIFAQTIFGVAIAAVWLSEKLHWGHLFGALTIIGGLVLGLSQRRVQNHTPTAALRNESG